MTRKLLAITIVALLATAVPVAQGQASCSCATQWAQAFTRYPSVQAKFDYYTGNYYHLASWKRDPVKGRIYDWARDGYLNPGFCNRSTLNNKICRAAAACIIAAGSTYASSKVAGASDRVAAESATISCAAAMASATVV